MGTHGSNVRAVGIIGVIKRSDARSWAALTNRGGTPVIPGKANRKIPIHVDAITYALRNRVERSFNKLKCSRRLATRYDKTAASYLGFIHIAAARIWVRSLST